MPRRLFVLDMTEDAELIAQYEAHHAPGAVWPRVIEHIRAQGAEAMEIWRAGNRLVMIAEVAEDYPRPVPAPPEIERWETLMWRYQRALPNARKGEKWVEMRRIFDLDRQ